MTPEQLQEIKARCEVASPGPWHWNVNPQSHHVRLESETGGRRIIMAFYRWGMQHAQPAFYVAGIMELASRLTALIPGREHHAAWARRLDHPDAAFIAHARTDIPALLAHIDDIEQRLLQWQSLVDGMYGQAACYTDMEGDEVLWGGLAVCDQMDLCLSCKSKTSAPSYWLHYITDWDEEAGCCNACAGKTAVQP